MRAAIYSRVSSEDQVRGYSLEAQQESCMRYIQEAKHDLHKVYVDDGYSAKNMKRPALQEMLADICAKNIDVVVIWRLDRLTRKAIDGLNMVYDIFNKYGVGFITIMEKHDLTTAQGRWMFTMSLANAQNEREVIGERVTFGQSKKASKGHRVSLGLIYGYDVIEGKLSVNETEAAVIRQIFELYVYKRWGYGKIATFLNSPEGAPAKRTVWWASTIKGILMNETYIGMNTWTPRSRDSITESGEHESILTVELFNMAQSQRSRRSNLEMSRSSYNYPFSSIIKCGDCGASYTAYYTKKPEDKEAYCNYRCQNKKSGLCHASDIAGMKLEKIFFAYFETLDNETQEYEPAPTKEEAHNTDKERKRLEKEISKIESRKSKFLDLLGDGTITREEYKSKTEEMNKSLTVLKEQAGHIQVMPKAEKVSSARIVNITKQLIEDWEYMEDEQRKFVIQVMFKRILIKKVNGVWDIIEIVPA